jgi:hypothetical protein
MGRRSDFDGLVQGEFAAWEQSVHEHLYSMFSSQPQGVQMKHVLAHFGGVLPEGLHVESLGADTC